MPMRRAWASAESRTFLPYPSTSSWSSRLHAVCACQTSTRTSRLRDTVRRLDAFSAHGRSACQTGGGLLPQATLALGDTPAAAIVSLGTAAKRVCCARSGRTTGAHPPRPTAGRSSATAHGRARVGVEGTHLHRPPASKKERTAASRIPTWSPTAVLTRRYHA